MTMERLQAPGLIVGWSSTIATWFTNAHEITKFSVTAAALVASIIGGMAAWEGRKLRRIEQRKAAAETDLADMLSRKARASEALELGQMCERCRDGNPPPICPLTKANRPKDCPHPEI